MINHRPFSLRNAFYRFTLLFISALLPVVSIGENPNDDVAKPAAILSPSVSKNEQQYFNNPAFRYAIVGYNKLRKNNAALKSIITVVDFSLPSTEKRLFVIDSNTGKILFQTYVSHGRNSGENFTNGFSNKEGSYMSSPGFYVTGNTYSGKHGLSLYLNGTEQGINDNALKRAIVVHGADYCSEEFIASNGRLGRSQGCPAVPVKDAPVLIDLIKEGSCFFIYTSQKDYLQRSAFLN